MFFKFIFVCLFVCVCACLRYLPTDENKAYFLALQQMIEEMAHKAGRPVALIAHSMGNVYTLYFLNQQPQAWKDKYIETFISLGPPWAGVAKTLRVVASGEKRSLFVCVCVGLGIGTDARIQFDYDSQANDSIQSDHN